MDAVTVFNFQDQHEVRTVIRNGEPWFVAKMRKLRDAENADMPVRRSKNKKRRSIWTRPAKKERAESDPLRMQARQLDRAFVGLGS